MTTSTSGASKSSASVTVGQARAMTIAGVILAAGAGSRFGGGGEKLRTDFRGRPLVRWAVDSMIGAQLDDLMVVTGAVDLRDALPEGVRVVPNEHWSRGIASSLGCAIALADRVGHDAIVVGLGDQPFVTTDAWTAVARTKSPIAVATYGGERGNPVRLAREVWSLLPSEGDVGARRLMADRPALVAEVACRGNAVDIDTQEDLARWS
jgi:CTP:molybdopterin cytidylyltransferase MocA